MDEDDLFRQMRRLKEENRSLKKLIKKLSKGNNRIEILEEMVKGIEDSESEVQEKSNKCRKCKTGTQKVIELGKIRKIISCDRCDFKEVIKSGNGKK